MSNSRSKNILLVSPTSPHEVGMTKWLSANLGIERIAGYLRAHGHKARTFDTNIHKAVRSHVSIQSVLDSELWDIIGFSVMEETLVEDITNMTLAKKCCPDALIVAGGHTAQFDYQTLLDKSPARIVVLGEGEIPLLKLANADPLDQIPGIVFKNPAVALTKEQFVEATLEIDYENIPYEMYWDYYVDLYKSNGIDITTDISKMIHTVRIFTRNYCPMKCKFCSSTNYLTFATNEKNVPIVDISGQQLIDLIKRIIVAHPRVETFYFTDDDFFCKKDEVKKFCQQIVEEGIKMDFIAFARIDKIDFELAVLIKKAGFRTLNMGFENFRPEILQEFNKSYSVETIYKNLELLASQEIRPAATFILCSPEAKLEWIEETTHRILDLMEKECIYPGVNMCVQPQKGSRFFEEYIEFESQLIPIPETDYFIKRNHFIQCTDPEVREFQYRFLYQWTHFIDDEINAKGHLNSQLQSAMKLRLALDVITEIKAERNKPHCRKYVDMNISERDALWNTLKKYSYSTSL